MARERIAINSTANSSRFPSKPVEILTGDRVITLAEIDQYQAFAFDPGGASRSIDLPAATACQGTLVFIANAADAAEVLTIRTAAGATVVTPTQSEAAVLWCDGASWYGLVGASS